MTDPGGPDAPSQRIDQLLFAGLAGLSVAVVLQLINKKPRFSEPLGVALLCFALGLPVLVSSFLLEVARPVQEKATRRRLFDLAGLLLALVGFVLLFFQIHLLA